MTEDQEREMHALAVQLERLTRETGWQASRYWAIANIMNRLAEFCAPDNTLRSQREGARHD